jgi:hypothetical protein
LWRAIYDRILVKGKLADAKWNDDENGVYLFFESLKAD